MPPMPRLFAMTPRGRVPSRTPDASCRHPARSLRRGRCDEVAVMVTTWPSRTRSLGRRLTRLFQLLQLTLVVFRHQQPIPLAGQEVNRGIPPVFPCPVSGMHRRRPVGDNRRVGYGATRDTQPPVSILFKGEGP